MIGTSFSTSTLAAISERPAAEVEPVLESLVAKQVLRYVDEQLSAERGQYVFLQGLLRTVALSTLGRRDRKAKHLAVARQLQETWREEAGDIAEVLASHYLAAVEADPDATDAAAIRAAPARRSRRRGAARCRWRSGPRPARISSAQQSSRRIRRPGGGCCVRRGPPRG